MGSHSFPKYGLPRIAWPFPDAGAQAAAGRTLAGAAAANTHLRLGRPPGCSTRPGPRPPAACRSPRSSLPRLPKRFSQVIADPSYPRSGWPGQL